MTVFLQDVSLQNVACIPVHARLQDVALNTVASGQQQVAMNAAVSVTHTQQWAK